MKNVICFCLVCFYISTTCFAQSVSYQEERDVIYTESKDEYRREKCRLDFYYPKDTKDFVTVIWFHGGGLTEGKKDIPADMKEKGIAVVSAGYRFAPKVKVDDIINDARDAVAWTMKHIEKYGGNKHKVILSGYSAGGYLALMLGLNKQYLGKVGVDVDQMMGIVSFSGQAITHFAARQEKGIGIKQPVVDELSPLYWVRGDAPPILLMTGDRELEMYGRYEENAYLKRMLGLSEHKAVKLIELGGYGHGMTYPAFPLLFRQIREWDVKKD